MEGPSYLEWIKLYLPALAGQLGHSLSVCNVSRQGSVMKQAQARLLAWLGTSLKDVLENLLWWLRLEVPQVPEENNSS